MLPVGPALGDELDVREKAIFPWVLSPPDPVVLNNAFPSKTMELFGAFFPETSETFNVGSFAETETTGETASGEAGVMVEAGWELLAAAWALL